MNKISIDLENALLALSKNNILQNAHKNYDDIVRDNSGKLFLILYHSQDVDYYIKNQCNKNSDSNSNSTSDLNLNSYSTSTSTSTSTLNSSSNSRTSFIYFARSGTNFDGHTLIKEVIESGNIFVGLESKISISNAKYLHDKHFIAVKDVVTALNHVLMGSQALDRDKIKSVGITGTNGKTSTTQIAAQLLENHFKNPVLKIGTLGIQAGTLNLPNSYVTTPDFPTMFTAIYQAQNLNIHNIVMEVTSHGLKENRVWDWKFNVSVFTNLTHDHLDYHTDMDDYLNSKLKLFTHHLTDDGWVVISFDNEKSLKFAQECASKKRTLIALFPNIQNESNAIIATHTSKESLLQNLSQSFKQVICIDCEDKNSTLDGISGTFILRKIKSNTNLRSNKNLESNTRSQPNISLESDSTQETIQKESFICPLIGSFQFENIMCSVGIGLSFGISLKELCLSLKKIIGIPGRLEVVPIDKESHPNAPTIVVDYAHTPDALKKAIQTCKESLPTGGEIITVFGCGGDRDPTKRPIMGAIANTLSHKIFVTSDNPRTESPDKIIDEICVGIKDDSNSNNAGNVQREKDRTIAIQKAIQMAKKNDVILIAGKGHEEYQIIGSTKYPFSDKNVVTTWFDRFHTIGNQ